MHTRGQDPWAGASNIILSRLLSVTTKVRLEDLRVLKE